MDASKEDYLRVMCELCEESGVECIRSIDIANRLKISKPSVSTMVKKLARKGLVRSERYSKIYLTHTGLKEGRRVLRNHRVIEVFLRAVLDYDISEVHEEAHRLEHAFSEESINRLEDFLRNSKESPYGKTALH